LYDMSAVVLCGARPAFLLDYAAVSTEVVTALAGAAAAAAEAPGAALAGRGWGDMSRGEGFKARVGRGARER
jgi:hypothetical protein